MYVCCNGRAREHLRRETCTIVHSRLYYRTESGAAMSQLRIVLIALCSCAAVVFLVRGHAIPEPTLLAAAQGAAAKVGNPITGEGLPNPAPKVTRNWGE